ncbi:DUF1150 family protein [Flavimaricola marinus]|uniref:DUF1150 domain-containing protein n=1 Tax=Flavimaricola marinus TaxID=1819565 RepID=A0A238LAL0_9RHOB|nr:DUF1150 family protein [Flavimaricola marinus]SMY05930.1 hypothetical protein LOM8899_00051 [Flavimaricola marinus]
MNSKADMNSPEGNFVYLKSVAVADLPVELREQAGDLETVFAVHNGEGEQVALVAHPSIASHLAEEHDMQLVTLH